MGTSVGTGVRAMRRLTTCTRCGTECYDVRKSGAAEICICCVHDLGTERLAARDGEIAQLRATVDRQAERIRQLQTIGGTR